MENVKNDLEKIYYCGDFLIKQIKFMCCIENFSEREKIIYERAINNMNAWKKYANSANCKNMILAVGALFINFREIVNSNISVRYHWDLFCTLSKRKIDCN